MDKYFSFLLLATRATSTFICTLSPTHSPSSSTTPTPTTNTNTSITLNPTFPPTAAPSPTSTIPTPSPTSAPSPTNNTTSTSTTLTSTTTTSSAPTPIPTTLTLTSVFRLAQTPTYNSTNNSTPTFAPSPALTPTSITTVTTTLSLPPTPPPLTFKQEDLKSVLQEQIDNIIDAVLGAGDFKNWASVLTMADPTTFPISATFFITSDNSLSPTTTTTTSDPFIFPYHIVPQRLAFADLQQFKAFSRFPTLILDKSTHHQQFCIKFHS
ncbi:hypothetical protein BDE02_11G135200 [Populus trichocarpa]|nr:hypothetical protein BDE02_11G135200 [Populus trichocarpa]